MSNIPATCLGHKQASWGSSVLMCILV